MRNKYYKLPISIDELFKKKKAKPKLYTTLKESLIQNLRLLFFTSHGEFRYDTDFGCVISSLDYTNEKQSGIFERSIKESLEKAIEKFEPRLQNVNVRIRYDRGGAVFRKNEKTAFKVFIVVTIKAMIRQLNEKFEQEFKIYFSPLSET